MRVLFVIPRRKPETAAPASMIFAQRQARALLMTGVDIRTFFLNTKPSPLSLFRDAARLREELRTHPPDIIHAQYGSLTALMCAMVARHCPLFITFRGSDLHRAIPRFLSKVAAINAEKCICVCERLKTVLGQPATVLPSGVDLSVFRPKDRTAARQRLGWELDKRVVLFNAGFDPINKGLDLARKAVQLVRNELPNTEMVVLHGRTGPDEIPDLLDAADCLLITSKKEGSPCMLQEALACRTPIVSVDVGDAAERLQGTKNTIIARATAPDLAIAIVKLIRAPLRSYADVEHLGFDYLAMRLKVLYEEICEHRTLPC